MNPDQLETLARDLEITSPASSTGRLGPSIGLSSRGPDRAKTNDKLKLDLSLSTALTSLIDRLVHHLPPTYPRATVDVLRSSLCTRLTALFAPTWREADPLYGTGFRSLICTKDKGLPRVLRDAAQDAGVEAQEWRKSLAGWITRGEDAEERDDWQAWCDPGMVMWRYGPWEWHDGDFDPVKALREPIQIIWQAPPYSSPDIPAPALTPLRPSHAIPIRAPAVYAIPPTPAGRDSRAGNRSSNNDPEILPDPALPISLLPSASIAHPHPLRPSHLRTTSAGGFSSRSPSPSGSELSDGSAAGGLPRSEHGAEGGAKNHARGATYPVTHAARAGNGNSHGHGHGHGHRGSGSESSVSSSISDSNTGATQLLTPTTRPASAVPFIVPTLKALSPQDDKTPTLRGRDPSPHSPRDQNASTSAALALTPSSVTATPSITPSVTPYDNGNVTVLGGGVKLGGSRPSSVMSSHRSPLDRSRSPSISVASRALSTALSPDGTGPTMSNRKTRSRRRITPTYLGHLHQPGAGGPVMGVFAQFAGSQPMGWQGGGPNMGVGAGLGPGPGHGVPPPPMPRMGVPQRM